MSWKVVFSYRGIGDRLTTAIVGADRYSLSAVRLRKAVRDLATRQTTLVGGLAWTSREVILACDVQHPRSTWRQLVSRRVPSRWPLRCLPMRGEVNLGRAMTEMAMPLVGMAYWKARGRVRVAIYARLPRPLGDWQEDEDLEFKLKDWLGGVPAHSPRPRFYQLIPRELFYGRA